MLKWIIPGGADRGTGALRIRAVGQLGWGDAATFGEERKLWVLREVAIWVQLPSTAPEMTESQTPAGCMVLMEAGR